MKEKILYVSDLDGTLLTSEQKLSDFTVKTINSLVEKGMLFSYATARSYATSSVVTKGLPENIPVIVYNGTFVLENGTKRMLLSNFFSKCETVEILDVLAKNGVFPIVYAYINGEEKFSYIPHSSTKAFLDTRRGDGRDNPVSFDSLLDGEVFHFSCIDCEEKLYPAYLVLKDKFPCVYNRDIYSGEQWLEVHPIGVSKAHAVKKLRELLGCAKVVCFGDGKNDISMFEVCDEGYAMENADADLKEKATGIIESNDNDGVAKWLAANC